MTDLSAVEAGEWVHIDGLGVSAVGGHADELEGVCCEWGTQMD